MTRRGGGPTRDEATAPKVYGNTMEGTWTGLRNFLRPFRGVSKWHLAGDLAIFEWANNLKRVTADFRRLFLAPP